MANLDSSTPPPPYSSVDFTQPPPRPYVDVYGLGPDLKPHTYPHYIPQYSASVVVPEAAQQNKAPSKKKRSCQSNTQCYSSLGAAILLLAFLALAIWLGIHFGTRLAKDDYDDNDEYQQYWDSRLPQSDTCPNNTVLCDAIRDCKQGSDETNCVRFGTNNSLQVRTARDGRFRPVCYQGWDQDYADQVCANLGFRKSHDTKPLQSQTSASLTLIGRTATPIQGLVNLSSSCPNQQTVSLQCLDCGKQQSALRIIGGSAAKTGQWPWQVSLHFRGSHVCGGVMIAHNFVVTAAHCFPSSMQSIHRWRVYGGTVSLDDLPRPYKLETIAINKLFNNMTNDQDVALIKLQAPVTFNSKVQPVCLPMTGQSFAPGLRCWTSGFGATVVGSDTASRNLKEVTVDLINTQVCNGTDMYHGTVTKNMICAGNSDGGKDSCKGDSGGPLVCEENNRWYLVGITSWGTGCGDRDKPGVYTKVSSVLPWIYSTMQRLTL